MISKEALNKLENVVIEANNFNEVSNDDFNSCVDAVDIIKKDLEVLDLIKKHYEMNGFNELIPLYLYSNDDTDAKDFSLIGE